MRQSIDELRGRRTGLRCCPEVEDRRESRVWRTNVIATAFPAYFLRPESEYCAQYWVNDSLMRATEPVNRLMSASVVWIDVDAPVQEVLRIFVEYPVHHLPVVDDHNVVGMLSSADVMKLEFFLPPSGAAREQLLGNRFRVRSLMRSPVITISEHESVERAAELMASHAIHSLPVLSQQGHLIGIVTTTDIMAGFLRSAGTNAGDTGVLLAATQECTRERMDSLERVAREARRYLNAGQDERLHAELTKAILSLDRIDERRSGSTAPILGLGAS